MIRLTIAHGRVLWCAVVCGSVLTLGCSKESDGGGASVAPQTNASGEAVEAQPLELPQGAEPQAVVDELNRELRKWVLRNRRRPASFEEFSAQLQVPPPPAGKRYVLTKEMRIELVNR